MAAASAAVSDSLAVIKTALAYFRLAYPLWRKNCNALEALLPADSTEAQRAQYSAVCALFEYMCEYPTSFPPLLTMLHSIAVKTASSSDLKPKDEDLDSFFDDLLSASVMRYDRYKTLKRTASAEGVDTLDASEKSSYDAYERLFKFANDYPSVIRSVHGISFLCTVKRMMQDARLADRFSPGPRCEQPHKRMRVDTGGDTVSAAAVPAPMPTFDVFAASPSSASTVAAAASPT